MARQLKTAYEALEEHPEVRRFESMFQARVEDSREYRQYQSPCGYQYDDDNFNRYELKVVPMKAIHMPIERFEKLLRQQDYIRQMENDAELGKKYWTQDQEDSSVRRQNPAVQRAYDRYKLLLEMARK